MTEAIAAVAGARAALVEMPQHLPLQATVYPSHGVRDAASSSGALRDSAAMLQDAGAKLFGSGSENPTALLANVERAALRSITPQDYLRSSMVATDLSMHVAMSMMKFHLSTSLGSAATGLFNTLLKNRD